MKILRRILSMVVIIMSVSPFPSPAEAQDDVRYLGEICYTWDEGMPLGSPPVGVRIGVMSFGAGYFVLSGVDSGFIPIHGAALIVENTIIISLYSSYVLPSLASTDSKLSTLSTIHMVVDATTLKGKYTKMSVQTTPEPSTISTRRGNVSLSLCN